MHQIHLQFTDQLYDQVQRRAAQAGFANLGEYIVDVVTDELASESENLDHRFSPQVVAHLDNLRHEIESGVKTCSEGDINEYLQEKALKWREFHAD